MSEQRERMRALLTENAGEWIPLPKVLDLRIAQYNRVIGELRDEGMVILNRTEHVGRSVHSWIKYVPDEKPPEMPGELFGSRFTQPTNVRVG